MVLKKNCRSNQLSRWNDLFGATVEILESEGLEKEEAAKLAKRALLNNADVTLSRSNDICNDIQGDELECNMNSKFRRL